MRRQRRRIEPMQTEWRTPRHQSRAADSRTQPECHSLGVVPPADGSSRNRTRSRARTSDAAQVTVSSFASTLCRISSRTHSKHHRAELRSNPAPRPPGTRRGYAHRRDTNRRPQSKTETPPTVLDCATVPECENAKPRSACTCISSSRKAAIAITAAVAASIVVTQGTPACTAAARMRPSSVRAPLPLGVFKTSATSSSANKSSSWDGLPGSS